MHPVSGMQEFRCLSQEMIGKEVKLFLKLRWTSEPDTLWKLSREMWLIEHHVRRSDGVRRGNDQEHAVDWQRNQ